MKRHTEAPQLGQPQPKTDMGSRARLWAQEKVASIGATATPLLTPVILSLPEGSRLKAGLLAATALVETGFLTHGLYARSRREGIDHQDYALLFHPLVGETIETNNIADPVVNISRGARRKPHPDGTYARKVSISGQTPDGRHVKKTIELTNLDISAAHFAAHFIQLIEDVQSTRSFDLPFHPSLTTHKEGLPRTIELLGPDIVQEGKIERAMIDMYLKSLSSEKRENTLDGLSALFDASIENIWEFIQTQGSKGIPTATTNTLYNIIQLAEIVASSQQSGDKVREGENKVRALIRKLEAVGPSIQAGANAAIANLERQADNLSGDASEELKYRADDIAALTSFPLDEQGEEIKLEGILAEIKHKLGMNKV